MEHGIQSMPARRHVYMLNEARRSGDVLVVGLNSDACVRSRKGPERPDRISAATEMLLAMRVVDYVRIFDEPDPIKFLEQVTPDVHANGAEPGFDCIESQTVRRSGGRIHVVDRIPGLSSGRVRRRSRCTAWARKSSRI
jgi:bifunctional ADP-heptose synthase (sugar kinase/adenylyltransferase)